MLRSGRPRRRARESAVVLVLVFVVERRVVSKDRKSERSEKKNKESREKERRRVKVLREERVR